MGNVESPEIHQHIYSQLTSIKVPRIHIWERTAFSISGAEKIQYPYSEDLSPATTQNG
jgi:hypothetical protein